MPRRPLQALLLAVLLSAIPLAINAQEKAQLPYSIVSSYLELFKSLQHLDRIIPSMMISSTNPVVSPQEIEFKIKTSIGWQSFSPDENGVFEFPDQPDWSNLVLISNQPKGTLQLLIGFLAKPLNSTSMSYQELMGLVPEFDEAFAALSSVQGESPPKTKGLTIQLSEGSGTAVHVLSESGKQTLASSSAGIVIVRYSEALWEENPPVELDEIPLGIVPLR